MAKAKTRRSPTCPHVTPGLQRSPHDLMAYLCPIAMNPTIRSNPYRPCALNSSQLFGQRRLPPGIESVAIWSQALMECKSLWNQQPD